VADVAVVVVTYNELPWIERCVESVRAFPTVVVDHGSTDGTLDAVRQFEGVRVFEQENRGLGAGWNVGIRETAERYVLLLNADAWALPGAVDRLVAFADEHPRAAVVGPKLLNPDGTLQRSVRGFPTPWRIATEFFFLRKLAPRSRALNSFSASNFDHAESRRVEWVKGSAMLVRRAAIDDVGGLDESFFLFNEESDWQYRFDRAGWENWYCADSEVVHVGGASTTQSWGRVYPIQIESHVRFIRKHHGDAAAELTRRILLTSLRMRALVFRGDRRAVSRAAADSLSRAS
jgi:N-acetylglucosaminyl-diphospho-decaprenol L-rhamnosyltransferase